MTENTVTRIERQAERPDEHEEPCLQDGTPIYPRRRLTRTERQQGMADRGCDTTDEYEGVR